MKFVINDDNLKIEEARTINSGSFRDYLIPVETDNSWNKLNIEARISKDSSKQGILRAVIDNKVYIDMSKKERYTIGFIGYTVENDEKIYQKSTDLKVIPMVVGAGEIEATNIEELPTASEWETYLNQVQEFINNANIKINEAENLDIDADGENVTITKKDGTTKTVYVKGEKGDCNFATFEVNDSMELVMNKTDDMLLEFNLNENGELEVLI